MSNMIQVLRGKGGEPVARMEMDSHGNAALRTIGGKLLGRYDAKANQTRNAVNALIGTGNLLAALVPAFPSNHKALGR